MIEVDIRLAIHIKKEIVENTQKVADVINIFYKSSTKWGNHKTMDMDKSVYLEVQIQFQMILKISQNGMLLIYDLWISNHGKLGVA